MKFEVINKDYAVIECQSLHSHTYGLLFMSVGGVMGTIIGFALIFLPYAQPSFQSLIPLNYILGVFGFVLGAVFVYLGNKYLKLTSFLAIDRKERKITKFENRLGRQVEKKEIYEWRNIKSIKAERYLYGEPESRPWGGVIYFTLKNHQKVEALAGKGKPPEKIVEYMSEFMKDPQDSVEKEGDDVYRSGFSITE